MELEDIPYMLNVVSTNDSMHSVLSRNQQKCIFYGRMTDFNELVSKNASSLNKFPVF